MANPGPATTITTNFQPVNTQQCLRLLGYVKACQVSAAGDVIMPLIGQVGSFVPTTVMTTNANVTMATATVGIYTGAAATGTAVLTTAALTGQTTTAFAYVRAATAAAANVTPNGFYLYVNIGTTVATGTVDVYLYGYDTSALA